MKILHILPSFDVGGLGSLGLSLIRAMPEHQHLAFAPRYPGTRPVLFASYRPLCEHVAQFPRSVMDPMGFAQKVAGWIKRYHLDAALIYNFADHVWMSVALEKAGYGKGKLPVICHVGTIPAEGYEEQIGKMLGSPFTEHVKFVFASSAVRDALAPKMRPETIGPVIWNGVDLEKYSRRAGGPMGWVGFSGRMSPGAKDFPTLIKAMGLVQERKPKSAPVLLLAGDGPLMHEYQQLAGKTAFKGHVIFKGLLSEDRMPGFLASLDLFVMAALPIEGMSIALVEAIAAGLPIIATDVPANREVLGSKAGILVRAGDAGEMADAIEHVIYKRHVRDELARRTQEYRGEFAVGVCAAKYLTLLSRPPTPVQSSEGAEGVTAASAQSSSQVASVAPADA